MHVSRVGKRPIAIPDQTTVKYKNMVVTVKGIKGELRQEIQTGINIEVKDGFVYVHPLDSSIRIKSLHGLYRNLIANMVEGVTHGFEKKLMLQGIGYRAELADNFIVFSLGYSTQIIYAIPDEIDIEYDKKETVTVRGIDKQRVGQVAAEIRSLRPPEPYKGKGIRYADEIIRIKAGKSGVK